MQPDEGLIDTEAPLQSILSQLDPKLIPVMISVGTYSSCVAGFLFPLDLDKDITKEGNPEDEEEMMFKTFSTKAHDGSVDTFATHGTFCFSGSSDETVCMFDMKKNVQEGEVKVARGPISKICMLNQFHDFAVASGNNLTFFSQLTPKGFFEVVWQVDNAHKKPIMDMDAHPSGRALITVGADGRLKLWNLLTAQMDFETHLESRADKVRWSPLGKSFAFTRKDTLVMHNADTADQIIELKHEHPITSIAYLNEYLICVGLKNGELLIYDVAERQLLHQITEVHKSRVKDIIVHEINVLEFLLVSVSSDGVISVLRVKEDAAQLQCIHDLDTRVHCVAVNFLKNVSRRLKKQYVLLEKMRARQLAEQGGEDAVEEEPEQAVEEAPVEETPAPEETKKSKKSSKKRKRDADDEAEPAEDEKRKKKKSKKSKKERKSKSEDKSERKKKKKSKKSKSE